MTTENRLNSIGALVIAAVLTFATTGQYAFGDNVVNDVVVGGNDTIDLASTTSTIIGYKVVATSGDGQPAMGAPQCNAADGSELALTLTVPAGVASSDADNILHFTVCNLFQYVTFTSTTVGTYSIGASTSDTGVGSYNNNAPFTLKVIDTTPVPTDSTAPEISYTKNGVFPPEPDGENGWYVSDALLDWTVSEPESPGSLVLAGCDDTTVNYDTTSDTFSCEATSDGGTAGPVEVIIMRDASPPTVTHTLVLSTPDGENGWYVSEIDLSWQYDDDISGIDNAQTVGCVDQILNTDFDTTTFSCDVTNNAGLSNSDSVDLKRDATAPDVSLVGGPDDGEGYYFGFVPSEPTCTASDDTSGLAGDCTVSGYSASVGTHTVKAEAEDNAGNTAEDSHTYEVLAWDLFGFYSPVEMDGVFNVIKGGQTVPLKFNIFAGATELTDTAYVDSLKYKKIACPTNGDFEPIEGDALATGGTVLRYDADSGQFIYNWKTPTNKNTCWEVTMTTDDGSTLKAKFQTK